MIKRQMQSEIFLRHDIEDILKAIDAASGDLADRAAGDEVQVYRAGFSAALRSVATALHIRWSSTTDAVWSSSRPTHLQLFEEGDKLITDKQTP